MNDTIPSSSNGPAKRPRVVLWIALAITLLGAVLLLDLVRSAKKSRELMRAPPASRDRFLGQGRDNDRSPPPRASASTSPVAPPAPSP